MDPIIELLKELTEAPGVSGHEGPVRAVARKHLESLGTLSQDRIGNLICRQEGQAGGPRVMLAAHMDEIGFMVKAISPEGFLRFITLGHWSDQVALGQRVLIHASSGPVVGVIGARPPHILTEEQRNKAIARKDLYIDIGATCKAEVEEAGIRPGDPVTPQAGFQELAGGKAYLSKAFDDRVGLALMIAALRELRETGHPNTVYGAATVMEEVGVRGAVTAVRAVDPDLAIVLESDIAADVPDVKPEESGSRLGKGPASLIYDTRTLPNLGLRRLVAEVAKESGIPLQTSWSEGGGNDAGAIHLHGLGVPVAVISVPTRHMHAPGSIIHRADFDAALRLVAALVLRLDAAKVAGLGD